MHSEQAAPDLLQKSLDASGIGWWQLDFGQREMTCSRLAADLFGADRTRISFEEVRLLPARSTGRAFTPAAPPSRSPTRSTKRSSRPTATDACKSEPWLPPTIR